MSFQPEGGGAGPFRCEQDGKANDETENSIKKHLPPAPLSQ